ncbi:transaldolase [Plectosphaerella plurivora]|uniref:Transaldolase n=1 Tax=Plectosphaerella plurivora TaxID=936078 RepID=A0A9P8V2S2_9PEZI|nr:transaldolase [Plectosphaerella plurivora]
MTSTTLLTKLREASQISCDTLDVQVAKDLGPFRDVTSNQAIALGELQKTGDDGKPYYQELLHSAVRDAKEWLHPLYTDIDPVILATEVMMVRLSIQFAPYVTHYLHIQTNPQWAYSTNKTVRNAERIVQIFQHLDPSLDSKRICIKIPSTWEGIAACRILEAKGIATLATTLFCMEQAALAAAANCTYIAPYVNELKVHFVPGHVDEHKAFDLTRQAQSYYERKGSRTQVLAASLTSVEEVVQLAGIHHVTVSPPLLRGLHGRAASSWEGDVGAYFAAGPEVTWDEDGFGTSVEDESRWRLAFTRSGGGVYEGKLIQAINIFSDQQDELEELAWGLF